jgi:hypothetical protein
MMHSEEKSGHPMSPVCNTSPYGQLFTTFSDSSRQMTRDTYKQGMECLADQSRLVQPGEFAS